MFRATVGMRTDPASGGSVQADLVVRCLPAIVKTSLNVTTQTRSAACTAFAAEIGWLGGGE